MAYTINKYNGSTAITVEDGTLNDSLDITLIGKNYAGYGEVQNENFVHLLENFSNSTETQAPITGQIWYDTDTKKIKVFTGQMSGSSKIWKSLTGAEYGTAMQESVATNGDLWFDTTSNKLRIRSLTEWRYVGGIVPVYANDAERNSDHPNPPIAGSLCLNGGTFQGYNGVGWVNLT